MPDSGASPSSIAGALAQVQQWLNHGPGSSWVQPDSHARQDIGGAWRVDLQDDTLPINAVRVVLPKNFPASSCELFVDRSYFLKVPHIEADGHVCLGLPPIPSDYEHPVGAVTRALQTFNNQLLILAKDQQWVEQQFQTERSSYWTQMCLRRNSESSQRPVPAQTYVDISSLDRWSRSSLVGYLKARTRHRRYTQQVAVLGDGDAHAMAVRHGWAVGTMVRGSALFVRLPTTAKWTPDQWPMTYASLDALIAQATNGEMSLSIWLSETGWMDIAPTSSAPTPEKHGRRTQDMPPPGQRPLLVVLVHDGAAFGYQIFAPQLPGLTPPHVEPLRVTRIDADWALARDHSLDGLQLRRSRRVLILGCGSLGSPLANSLARAGVGQLDLVDAQTMGAENTARHELGIDDIGQGKAPALARRMSKEIPGLKVRGFIGDVESWCAKNCRAGDYDLIVECTGESAVRTYLAHMRAVLFGACPLVHAWTEPLCSAGHVVLTQPDEPWPSEDPADTLVNASVSGETTSFSIFSGRA